MWAMIWLTLGVYLYLTDDWSNSEKTWYVAGGLIVLGFILKQLLSILLQLLGTKPESHRKHHPDVREFLSRPSVQLGRAPKSN